MSKTPRGRLARAAGPGVGARLRRAKRSSSTLGEHGLTQKQVWAELLARRRALSTLYAADAIERVEQVRAGVPAQMLELLSEDMGLPKDTLYTTLRLPRATLNRKLSRRQTLNQDESERVLGIARLVGQVDAIVEQSGDHAGFDAAKWVAVWIDQPHPALGNRRPADLMDTSDGRALVVGLLSQMQSGAYA